MACVVGLLANGIDDMSLLISVFSFNLLWIFIDVYQMSTIANIDIAGKYAAMMPAAQGLGQIIGPVISASLLDSEFGYSGVFFMCSGAALLALGIYFYMFFTFRKKLPELAYAS